MLDKYALSSKELHEILIKKGIAFLHHVNTIATSLTFIQQGALLSRGYVETHGLIQTPQDSDDKDKYHDIWDAAFLDGTDHHVAYGRNIYGPVLFKIKLDLLLSEDFAEVLITRSNPCYWTDDKPLEKKFYDTLEEFDKDYDITGYDNTSGMMLIFVSPEKKIDFSTYLDSIVLDDPKLRIKVEENDIEARDHLLPLIKRAISENSNPDAALYLRGNDYPGHNFCHGKCYKQYEHLHKTECLEFNKMFTRLGHYK